jgi:hypothetical protein
MNEEQRKLFLESAKDILLLSQLELLQPTILYSLAIWH